MLLDVKTSPIYRIQYIELLSPESKVQQWGRRKKKKISKRTVERN